MQYRNLLLLALSLGLTITIAPSISLAKPAASTIAPNSDRLTAPKFVPSAEDKLDQNPEQQIEQRLQKEATVLSQPDSMEKFEILGTLRRTIQAYFLERVVDSVPSKGAIAPLADLAKKYPNSLTIELLQAESFADGASDAQIEKIFTDLQAKHRKNSPQILNTYAATMATKYEAIPAPVMATLNRLFDREIAQQPRNVFLYVGRAQVMAKSIEERFAHWQTTASKVNQPIVALAFGRGIFESQTERADQTPDPKVMAQLLQRLETAIQQHPQELELYTLYTKIARAAKIPTQKLLPIYQAGLSKGADSQMLNYLIGDAYLFSGAETQALSQYQKVIQGKMSLCADEMDELLESRFNAFKRPENQRAMLNLILRSMAITGKEEYCTSILLDISANSETGQKHGKDIITAMTPIARSSNSFHLRGVLLGLMRMQEQHAEVVKLGPELLPANSAELDKTTYMSAAVLPWQIALAYESLGNFEQSARFFNLLNDYKKVFSGAERKAEINHTHDWHLGRLAWKSGKSDQAIQLLQRVTGNPKISVMIEMPDAQLLQARALAHNLLGEIYQSQGKKVEAKREFEAAIKADEQFQAPKDNLAKLK